MPITSPVDRISGPSVGSAPANRWNGSTAALTETWPTVVSGRSTASPSAARHAASTRSRPVAFETNGTVRDARGLASRT